jgi:geranylgeranyl pyrophosphate synthase
VDGVVDGSVEVDRLVGCVRERLGTPASCGVPHVDRLVADALRPGKLLRPHLVVRSAVAAAPPGRALGPKAAERVVAGAVAVELLHVATLVHDDVIDDADLRRGRPSVVAAAGVGTAIVVGDLLLARGVAAAAEVTGSAVVAWSRALESMAAGQLREEGLAAEPSVQAHAEYAALKTAALLRSAAEIGALAVSAPDDVVAAHGRFGHHVGMALQHLDDLLDAIGDPHRMGKPTGSDAANAVPTAAALLGAGGSGGGIAPLVLDELAAGRTALGPGAVVEQLGDWASHALGRALEGGLDDAGRRRAGDLVAALVRSA